MLRRSAVLMAEVVTTHLQFCSHLCTAIMYAPTNNPWYLSSRYAYSTIVNAARTFRVLKLSNYSLTHASFTLHIQDPQLALL